MDSMLRGKNLEDYKPSAVAAADDMCEVHIAEIPPSSHDSAKAMSTHDNKSTAEAPEPKSPVGATVYPPAGDEIVSDIPVDAPYELQDSDNNSAYENDFDADDTCSLSSFITKYRFENGRRYHAYKDGAYWAPNDEIQNDQQDIAHHLWLLTLDNQLYLAPIINPQSILDIGTGTGIWAIDMADMFPSAVVIGCDLSPIQPQWLPANCSFEVDDVTLPWTYRPESFDFIHIREMFGSVSDWDALYAQAYQALKPGGYLENCEHSITPVSDDNTVTPDHIFQQYGRIMNQMGRMRGKEFDIWKHVKDGMVRAGFVDVVEMRTKWPMSGWSSDRKMKNMGRWNQLRIDQGIEGYAMRLLTIVGGWSYTEVQALVGKIRAALKDRTVHGYLDVTVVYGRKPL